MFNISDISNKIALKLSEELGYDDDKTSVINYGIFAWVQMLISILLVLIFGSLFLVVAESILVSFVISILRKSSGGVHANTPGKCAIIGTIVSVCGGLMAKYLSVTSERNIFIGIIVFGISYIIIYKLAPVDSIAKPIKKKEKRKRLKKNSLIILTVYLLIVISNMIIYFAYREEKFLSYNLCIYVGIIWQVFSLTKSGNFILEKLNYILKDISI